ncbi:hypothetical protein LUZ60_015168 [Juncus effusus]|nr:hypothetical protein LUZ60_015168 [Juncus effusus]
MEVRFLANSIVVLLLIQCGVLSMAGGANQTQAQTGLVPAIFIFGDSIMDTGNNDVIETIVKANFPPYGRDFIGKKATGRFSNGKVTSDIIASTLGVKEYMPPYLGTELTTDDLLTGVVFASAGTGFDIVTSSIVNVIPMKKQLEMFQEYKSKLIALVGEKKANDVISKALFILCAGSNDVNQYFLNFVTMAMVGRKGYGEHLKNMASEYVKELYNLGARIFGVIGMPPIGCVPFQRTVAGGLHRDCAADRNEIALDYNTKMIDEIERLKTQNVLPGSKIVFIDVYPHLMELIDHPEKYGFTEVRRGCCGTGMVETATLCNSFCVTCKNTSEYVFWDSYHPTERASTTLVDLANFKKTLQSIL